MKTAMVTVAPVRQGGVLKFKKIVLVNPRFPNLFEEDSSSASEPVNLISLASVLEKSGYEVQVYNGVMEANYIQDILDDLDETDVLGITAMTCQIKDGLKLCKAVKAKKNIPIIWGGCHPTLYPDQTCASPFVDFVVCEEGEETLLELLNNLNTKEDYKDVEGYSDIKGLVYKDGDDIFIAPKRGKVDFEKLPFMSYHLLDMEKYINFRSELNGGKYRRITYQTSRGCPYRCTFCINYVTGERKYRRKDVSKVINDLKFLVNKYNVNYFKIRDENFFVNVDRCREICEAIIEEGLNITLEISCRADNFRKGRLDEDLLPLFKKAGLTRLNIGAESGSQRMLDYMKKDVTVTDLVNSAKQCGKYGLIPIYSFMCGLPTETKAEMMETIKLIKNIKKYCPTASFIGPQIFRPYPGGDLYTQAMEIGKLKAPESLEDWDKEEYTKFYDARTSLVPWNEYPVYVKHMQNYVGLSVGYRNSLRNLIKNISIKNLGKIPFVLVAKMRWKMNMFGFPIEQQLFGYMQARMLKRGK